MAGSLELVVFLSKAETNNLDTRGCWEWQGPINSNGYGRYCVENGHKLAHRYSFKQFYGAIPDGKNVCHRCDNRRCINPHHLFLGTQSENLKDAVEKGRLTPPALAGVANGNSRLSLADVVEIRAMHARGILMKNIAPIFSISLSSVSDIIRGRTWKSANQC